MIGVAYIVEIKKRLLSSNLFKDSFWALFGTVIGKALSLFAGIIVARFLGKGLYGEYGMIKSTLINISVFSTLGLGYTATRFIANHMQEDESSVSSIINDVLKITVYFSSTIFFLVFLFAQSIANYLKVPETTNAFRLAAFIILVNAISTTQIGILAGFKAFKVTAINSSVVGGVTFFLSTLLTYMYGLNGALVALFISIVIGTVLNTISINNLKKRLCNQKAHVKRTKELISFSIPVALQEFLYTVVVWGCSMIMVKYSNYEELGLLGASSQWISIIYFIPGALKNVALSYLSSEGNVHLYKRMLQINFMATFVPYLFVLVFSSFITSMYGSKYDGLWIVLVIGTAQPIFTSMSTVIIYEFIARNKTWLMFMVRLVRESSILVLVWIGLHLFTSNGALIVSLIQVVVSILFFVIMFFVSRKYICCN